MRLTRDEFAEFRRRFTFLLWPDEVYTIPVEVDLGERGRWTVFIKDPPFHEIVEWLHVRRRAHDSSGYHTPARAA